LGVTAVLAALVWFTGCVACLLKILLALAVFLAVIILLVRRGGRHVKPIPSFAVFVAPPPAYIKLDENSCSFEKVQNMRDVGGYLTADGQHRVKRKCVYRSACFAEATESDLKKLDELGLKAVWDLRLDHERAKEPNKFPGAGSVVVNRCVLEAGMTKWEVFLHIVGVLNATFFNRHLLRDGLKGHYVSLVRVGASQTRDFFNSLARAGATPLVIHCSAGKDRTGIMCALLLALLGVPDDVIAYDYSLSNHSSEYIMEWLSKTRSLSKFGIPDSDFRGGFVSDPANIKHVLTDIRSRHGTIDAFFAKEVGLPLGILAQVRAALLEPV